MSTFKPVAGSLNRVVIEPLPAETVTPGGIIIPDTAQEKPQKGVVIAVSDEDEKGKKPVVKKGDLVFYGKYSGSEFPFEGKDYLIMKENEVLAIINK